MLSSTSQVTSNAATAASTSATSGIANADASQDRFLKLLVAQLNNQDPMNPMDNAQMTSQIAQINTVTGIQQVNDTLKSMADQFAVLQVLQGSAMVGRHVLIEGSTLAVQDGKAGAAIDLATSSDTTKVEVVSPGGQIIDTINLGALAAGRHSFEWDATAYMGTGAPTFRVLATSAGQPVTATNLVRDKVVSVGSENGAMLVQLQGHNPVGYASIKAML